MKVTHKFKIRVKTPLSREAAEFALLSAFAKRGPDGCEFSLDKSKPNKTIKRKES